MKTVAVVGHGYVGSAVQCFFANHFKVVIYDPKYFVTDEKKDEARREANTAELAVVCVPTPASDDDSVDLSFVKDAISWLDVPLILIKSTIPPGTVDALKAEYPNKRICFSPEYIGEGKYAVNDLTYPHPTDMKKHSFHIFGGDRDDCIAVGEFFKTVAGPEARYYFTSAKTAEIVKYMENSWGATKVTFCNEFYDIAKNFGVEYDEVRELWLLDGRVERMHTAVFKDKRGFGGKCFPKDVKGIVKASKDAGYTPKLLESVLKVNEEMVQK